MSILQYCIIYMQPLYLIITHFYDIFSHLFQKRNQRWRSADKRSDVVKYLDIKNDGEVNTEYLQETQG